jgi:hypothetical protein
VLEGAGVRRDIHTTYNIPCWILYRQSVYKRLGETGMLRDRHGGRGNEGDGTGLVAGGEHVELGRRADSQGRSEMLRVCCSSVRIRGLAVESFCRDELILDTTAMLCVDLSGSVRKRRLDVDEVIIYHEIECGLMMLVRG